MDFEYVEISAAKRLRLSLTFYRSFNVHCLRPAFMAARTALLRLCLIQPMDTDIH